MSDAESPPLTFQLAADTVAKAVYTVTGAPLTTTGEWALSIYPREVELLAKLGYHADELCWTVSMATVRGLWHTNQGNPSETESDLTFFLPLDLTRARNEVVTPDWLKIICADWVDLLGRLLPEEY